MSDLTIELKAPVIIHLQPEWFQNGYYVYVVTIKFNDEIYYYIGMTGDRNHTVARSPFYRMSGHFSTRKSTENQIVKGIERTFGASVKDDNVLTKMSFTYYSWMIQPFHKDIDKMKHHENRVAAEKIESGLIVKCRNGFGTERVFNHQLSRKDFTGFETEVGQMFEQLKHLTNE